SKCARQGVRRRSPRLRPPSAVEEGPGSLREKTRGGSRGPRRPGSGEGGITTPRRGDAALLGNGGRADPRTRGRRGIAFTTDTRDGGERAQECRPRLMTAPRRRGVYRSRTSWSRPAANYTPACRPPQDVEVATVHTAIWPSPAGAGSSTQICLSFGYFRLI